MPKTKCTTAQQKYAHIDSPKIIGKAIRLARKKAGLRVVDTAMLCRMAVQTYVDIEAGRPGVGIGKILRVADGFGVSLFVVPDARDRNLIKNLLDSYPNSFFMHFD